MNTIVGNGRMAALGGLLLVLPFVLLEYAFNIANNPAALDAQNLAGLAMLFGLMWLLPMAFIAMLTPLVREIRAGPSIAARPLVLVLRVAVLIMVAWAWGSLVADQLPCFLGVPNCD